MKCYVCKFVGSAAEARRHPNETTIQVAKSLHQRLVAHKRDRRTDHICGVHQDPSMRATSLDVAFKDLEVAINPRKKNGKKNGKKVRELTIPEGEVIQ